MNEKQKRVYELLKEFIEIANKHNLDYMVFYGTLLGVIRHGGFIPWDDDIDLVVTKETLDFLVANYPEKVKVNENSDNFLLIPKFTNDDEWDEDAVFLDLFVAAPTTPERVKKFLSTKTKIRYLHSYTHRRISPRQWGMKLAKFFLCWTWGTNRYLLKDAWNDLYDPNGTEVAVICWPFKKVTMSNVFDELDFKTTEMKQFEDLSVKVPKNWESILVKNYGPKWYIPKKIKMSEHLGLYDIEIYTHKKKKPSKKETEKE
ncbi:diacylglycerol cholinephosphotransferase Mf1 [Mycoplasmopsis adleri]|uniref:diacylglycerol cholinephosphotransferase Mf1 n=1 Tax=Mycoplasmopsis adleri TaxID=51362 RepID=UPI0038739082